MMGFRNDCVDCVGQRGVCPRHYELWLAVERGYLDPPTGKSILGSLKGGLKDLTKPPAHTGLIANFPNALLELAALSAYGVSAIAGRTPLDWHQVVNGIAAYSDAAMRHILARQIDASGVDPQSKYPHLTHAIWSWLAVRELEIILDKNPGPVV